MATEVEICNSAIAKVRGRAILTMEDNTTEGRLVSALYNPTRKKLLRAHPWNFAKKRADLALLEDAPVSGFDNAFQLPTDCLRVLETDLLPHDEWALESDSRILTNESAIAVLYVADITDASKFDATFSEVLAYMMAEQLALPLTNGASIAAAMRAAAKEELREARSFNGQERGSQKQVEASEWLDSRY